MKDVKPRMIDRPAEPTNKNPDDSRTLIFAGLPIIGSFLLSAGADQKLWGLLHWLLPGRSPSAVYALFVALIAALSIALVGCTLVVKGKRLDGFGLISSVMAPLAALGFVLVSMAWRINESGANIVIVVVVNFLLCAYGLSPRRRFFGNSFFSLVIEFILQVFYCILIAPPLFVIQNISYRLNHGLMSDYVISPFGLAVCMTPFIVLAHADMRHRRLESLVLQGAMSIAILLIVPDTIQETWLNASRSTGEVFLDMRVFVLILVIASIVTANLLAAQGPLRPLVSVEASLAFFALFGLLFGVLLWAGWVVVGSSRAIDWVIQTHFASLTIFGVYVGIWRFSEDQLVLLINRFVVRA